MKLMARTVVVAAVATSVPTCWGRPILFRTNSVTCELSMDGVRAVSVGDNFFARIDVGPGDHIVECSGTFRLVLDQQQNSRAIDSPFAISSTLSITDGPEQQIINLPDPVIRMKDIARSIGTGHISASAQFYGSSVLNTACGSNDYEDAIGDAQEDIRKKQEARNSATYDTSFMNQMCQDNPDSTSCRDAKKDYMDGNRKAQDKLDDANDAKTSAYNRRQNFYNALQQGAFLIFPNSRKTCNNQELVTIQYKGEDFLAPLDFVIRSDQGGTFHIK